MQQTPAHEQHNPDLLGLLPVDAKRLVEIGCSSGALAREFKKISPACHYVGVEIDPAYAELAKRYCDETAVLDVEGADAAFWGSNAHTDCWVFGDTLEHFKDPWRILSDIRSIIPENGCIVTCIPNVQHWSIQAKISIGDFRYQASGLLDKTHLRWFTRKTMLEMFQQSGFRAEIGRSRIFNEPMRDRFIPLIEKMAIAAGHDPKEAASDAMALQYVFRLRPI